jgi:hypothetical protein
MRRHIVLIGTGVIVLLVSSFFWLGPTVFAMLSGCDVDITPHQIETGVISTVTVSITNTDGSGVARSAIFRVPNNYYTIDSVADAQGGSASIDGQQLTIRDIAIPAHETQNFQIRISGSNNSSSAPWTIQLSDSSDASGDFKTCYGGHTTSLVTTAVHISNLSNF